MTGGTTRAGLELVHGELTREIIGAFYSVYNTLGYGFVESVYQRSLPHALAIRGLKSEREVALTVHYMDFVVGDYRADLVVEKKVILEIKTADRILPVHEMQLLNYLKATRIPVGMVLNFGPNPTFRRMLLLSPKEGKEGSVVIRA
jgi:GxxExxY protein